MEVETHYLTIHSVEGRKPLTVDLVTDDTARLKQMFFHVPGTGNKMRTYELDKQGVDVLLELCQQYKSLYTRNKPKGL